MSHAVPAKAVKEDPVLNADLFVVKGLGYSLFQIKTTKKGTSSVVEFSFDEKLKPNLMANEVVGTKGDKRSNTKTKSPNATYCSVRIGQNYEVDGEFGQQVTEMITSRVVPEVIKAVKETPYNNQPKDVRFYLYKKKRRAF